MLFKRQKILLALLEEFGGELKNIDLQKYLFLLSLSQRDRAYHFVPYKYGCFSFQAYQDKRKLTEKGYLKPVTDWQLAEKHNFREMLTYDDTKEIWQIRNDFETLKGDDLLGYVYRKYPYYAIKSTIASRVLSKKEMQVVEKAKPQKRGYVLCSIGYEGKSLEEYLNILIQEDIKVLCDVRKNPISRKYGFSKSTLMNALDALGIDYVHCPELGIDSKQRVSLESQNDYDRLFSEYESTTLKDNYEGVIRLCKLLKKQKRIAVTCYERLPQQCHRTRVANSILEMNGKLRFIEA
jgi:uncharacterized protein (DUF488 family)